jgi:hypothetical protein
VEVRDFFPQLWQSRYILRWEIAEAVLLFVAQLEHRGRGECPTG